VKPIRCRCFTAAPPRPAPPRTSPPLPPLSQPLQNGLLRLLRLAGREQLRLHVVAQERGELGEAAWERLA